MWDDGTGSDTVQAAQAENERTVQNPRRATNPAPRREDNSLRSTRARGQLEPMGSRLAMQGDTVRLDPYSGAQPVRDTRGDRGRLSNSYDPQGILDLPAGRTRNENPDAQKFDTRGYVIEQPVEQPTDYRPESAAKLSRKTLAASVAGPGSHWTYVVKKGDTLERIARRHLDDPRRWTEIQALNGNIDPRRVRLGQKLVMPARRASRGTTPSAKNPATTKPREASYKKPTPAPAKNQGGEYYVVQPGDVLGKISLKTLGTSKRWREILDLNPKVDPRRLMVGTKLRLPKRGAGTPAPLGQQVAKNDVRTIPASVRKTNKSGKSGFVVR
jgi:nucleoid-associated protein YgaU